jgi:hypothetical protein
MDDNASMMNALPINERACDCGEYHIRGACYQLQDSSKIWKVNVTFPDPNRSQVWLVSGDAFKSIIAARNLLTPPPTFGVVDGGPVTDIDSRIKRSVNDAIHKWESEPACREFE